MVLARYRITADSFLLFFVYGVQRRFHWISTLHAYAKYENRLHFMKSRNVNS